MIIFSCWTDLSLVVHFYNVITLNDSTGFLVPGLVNNRNWLSCVKAINYVTITLCLHTKCPQKVISGQNVLIDMEENYAPPLSTSV